MNAQPTSGPRRQSLEALLLLGLLAVVVVLVVYFATKPAAPTQTTANSATNARLVTPKSFTSFYGTLKQLDGTTATITFHGNNDAGQATATDYLVHITVATTLSRVGSTATVTLNDLKSGQNVVVAADHNIAAESAFTATSIQLY